MATQAFNLTGPAPQLGGQPNAPLLANMALSYGGTGAIPAVQDSEYLANALAQMQQNGAQESKTPLALGSNLLAEALLQMGRHRSNKSLLQAVQQGQNAYFNGGPKIPGLDTPSVADPSVASLPPPPVNGGTAAAQVDAPGVGQTPAPGEASNQPGPQGALLQALMSKGMGAWGAAGLVGNFANESGPNLNRDNPSEGAIGPANWRGPRADAYRAFLAANGGQATPDNEAGFIMQELGGPEARAFRMAQAAHDPASATAAGLAYERPAGWTMANPGAASAYGARLASTQALGPQAGPSGPAPAGPAPAAPGAPYQVAANGPTPAPPGAPPMPAPQMAPQSGIPAGSVGDPMPVSPQQIAAFRQLQAAYQNAPEGSQAKALYGQRMLEMRQALFEQTQKRLDVTTSRPTEGGQVVLSDNAGRTYVRTPDGLMFPAKPQMTNGPNGPALVQGTGFTNTPTGINGVTKQTSAAGEVTYPTQPGSVPSLANGQTFGPKGITNQPLAAGSENLSPTAQIPPGLSDVYTKTVAQLHADPAWQDYQNSVNAANALEGVLKNAAGPNGVVAQAALDNTIRAMTGLSARIGSVNSLLDHLPLSEQLKGKLNQMFGNMALSPAVVGQMRDVIRGYGMGHEVSAQQAYDNYNGGAHRQGFDLGLSLPQMSPAGQYSWLPDATGVQGAHGSSGFGAAGGSGNPGGTVAGRTAAGSAITPEQARAELQRRASTRRAGP